jgi:chorismate-pyruvate lyase
LLAREYVIITNNEILMWIKEIFPISHFKWNEKLEST